MLFTFQIKDRANDCVWRVRFNHPQSQFEQGLGRFFLCLKDGGLGYVEFPRSLRTRFAGLLSKSFGQASQPIFFNRLVPQHTVIIENKGDLPTLFSCLLLSFSGMK
jgi:hypothetical protein